MDSLRRTALIAGVLFIITFVASIPAVLLYGPVLSDPNYVIGSGADARIPLGALLEVVTVIANIGTAVVLFPVLRRQNEGIALGYVAARLVEGTFIVVGIVCLLAVVTLRQDFALAPGADKAAFVTAGKALVAVHDWTFLFGPGFLGAGFGNGILLGYLMYRSALVPRPMAWLGLVGGLRLCDRRAVWRHRRRFDMAGRRNHSGDPVGGVARPLPHLQGLQAFAHHVSRWLTTRWPPGGAGQRRE